MDRSIRVSCDFELPSHASTTCSAKKGDLEPIICMSPAALMVSWVADVWPVNCTGYASPLNRSVSPFQSGTQPARHTHLRPTGVRNFPAPGFTSKIVLLCRLGCRGIKGNVRTKLLVMVISASRIVKRGVLLAQSIVFMDVVGRPLRSPAAPPLSWLFVPKQVISRDRRDGPARGWPLFNMDGMANLADILLKII